MNSGPGGDLPASSVRKHLLPLALSLVSVGVGSWSYVGILVILSPGLYIVHWFMPAHFATQRVRLAIIAGISVFVYWPVFFFLLEFVRDRKKILRFTTPLRLLCALGIGAAASLIAHKLMTLIPTVFGLLNVPSDYASFFVYTLFDAGRSIRWFLPLRLVGDCLFYGVIAFFVLYKTVWSKSTNPDNPHP